MKRLTYSRRWVILFAALLLAPAGRGRAADAAPPRDDTPLDSGIAPEAVEDRPYADYVIECADLLMEHGTDRYGKKKLPILVTYLDVRTRDCPEDPPVENPYWRGQNRVCLWKPRGSDLLVDQVTIEVLYALTTLTGDKGYRIFANDYIKAATALKDERGMFWWGWHRYYDVFADEMTGSNDNHHEIQIIRPRWEILHDVRKRATRRELKGIWRWNLIDKASGEHNRHADGATGCDFAMTGGEFIYALSFLYSKTQDDAYLTAAERIADYHRRARHPETDLVPNRPNEVKRFDGLHFDTSITGLHSYYLLKSYELLGVETFRNYALAYLRSYAAYGYDADTEQFWGSIRLDGTPEMVRLETDGYAAFEARGHVRLWQPYQLGYEYPLFTAQAYAFAYQLTGAEDMLDVARRWAECIRRNPPSRGCEPDPSSPGYAERYSRFGAFADDYGRTISFFVHMFALTGEESFLDDARSTAQEAVSKLYYKGLIRGHPAKPYYGSVDGVGYLLYSLLQLDRVLEFKDEVVKTRTIPIRHDSDAMLAFDNW